MAGWRRNQMGPSYFEMMHKKLTSMRSLLAALLSAFAGFPGIAYAQLEAGPNGSVLKEGKLYRGIGVNYFDCFLRTLKSGEDTSYDAGLATLAEKGIPFARFCATGFWPRDMELYRSDRAEYFRRLDGVVKAAEKHGVGLIPSLFWLSSCVPDLVGEPMEEWANPKSKTQAWMREYVHEVVTRYRDSPAIWAWEFGNEYSLGANLPNAKEHRAAVHPTLGTATARSERDDLTFDILRAAFTAFATEVRKSDGRRLILTGDSFLRASAWHQEHGGTWGKDAPEQFAEMLAKVNPEPVNAISVHMYGNDDQRLEMAVEAARKLQKPLFVGEFGAPGETPKAAEDVRRMLKAIADDGAPLAALWVFDLSSQKDFNVTGGNARAWQLDLVREANEGLRTKE
jgi:Cellulase (glycosyl hydrolase family 5)